VSAIIEYNWRGRRVAVYLVGFGNHHISEAIPGALPASQNSPQKCALGLYAEQLSGSAFTRPRHANLSSWLYRALPSVVSHEYTQYARSINQKFAPIQAPNPHRWSPRSEPSTVLDFIDGLFHLAGNHLLNSYLYQCNQSMTTRYFSNNDGELLFVPYQGKIRLRTEFGLLEIAPGMIAVIPRGVKFKVELMESSAAGYLCENAGTPLTLPQLGVIGANGLASPRHFLYPKAAFEEPRNNVSLICKYQQNWWIARSDHSPLDVVAWHGNYAPYSYDLSLFNTINTVSFDHPDPSIFTVLTSESDTPGVANLDFVIFPSRWMVGENTFRPPYYHRNMMSELMGLVLGTYDAKKEGFAIGGVSIHNCMTAHGPDAQTYEKESKKQLKPEHYKHTLAFMFESREPWQVTETALNHETKQKNYSTCWQELKREFVF
jgi:homogentisate 1,2-dioxygenase